jgi:hypothetical protein
MPRIVRPAQVVHPIPRIDVFLASLALGAAAGASGCHRPPFCVDRGAATGGDLGEASFVARVAALVACAPGPQTNDPPRLGGAVAPVGPAPVTPPVVPLVPPPATTRIDDPLVRGPQGGGRRVSPHVSTEHATRLPRRVHAATTSR